MPEEPAFDPNSGSLLDALRGSLTSKATLLSALAGAVPAGLLGAYTAARGNPSLRKETPGQRRSRIARQALTYATLGGLGTGALRVGWDLINNPSPYGGNTGGPMEQALPRIGGVTGGALGLVSGSTTAMTGNLAEKYTEAANDQIKRFHGKLEGGLKDSVKLFKDSEADRIRKSFIPTDIDALKKSMPKATAAQLREAAKSLDTARLNDALRTVSSVGDIKLNQEDVARLLKMSPKDAVKYINAHHLPEEMMTGRPVSIEQLRRAVSESTGGGRGPRQFYENFRGGGVKVDPAWGRQVANWSDKTPVRDTLSTINQAKNLGHTNNILQARVRPVVHRTALGAGLGYGVPWLASKIPAVADSGNKALRDLFGD